MLSELFSATSGWKYVNTKDGVIVEKRTLPAGSFVDASDAEKGSKHACVKSTGVVKAPLDVVFELFTDNSRVSEYNEHCKVMKDVHQFPQKGKAPFAADSGADGMGGGSTKITWAHSLSPLGEVISYRDDTPTPTTPLRHRVRDSGR